jgi:hypothetical protein
LFVRRPRRLIAARKHEQQRNAQDCSLHHHDTPGPTAIMQKDLPVLSIATRPQWVGVHIILLHYGLTRLGKGAGAYPR